MTTFVGLIAGGRGDTGGPGDAKGAQTGHRQGGEAGRPQTRLA